MEIIINAPMDQQLSEGDMIPMGEGILKAKVVAVGPGSVIAVQDPTGKIFEGQRPQDSPVFRLPLRS